MTESPVTQFELIESIRFFGEIVATPGISDKAKDMCNAYIERLVEALGSSVDKTTAKAAGLKLIN